MNHKGKLKDGLLFREKRQYDFEMRPLQTAGELFDAEIESGGVENQLAFHGSLMARQLKRIGECTGPFSISQVRSLSPRDWKILRAAQAQLNTEDDDPNAESDSANS
ncbi:hypothetical protein [Oceanobacter kriegii]|uniref:hypothetical protein n=1 Tax=Oceanobacter kriegii TaxID=64972 RepID=UPI0004097977|nr:hypothetical protein [Oceanobacter kriegii]